MNEKQIISKNQFVWLLFPVLTSFSTLHVPRLLMYQAGRDAWLSVILAWFLDVLLALVYAYMGIRFPGQNMVQYSETILGKKAGKIVGIMFPLFFLLVAVLMQRGLSIFINKSFFPNTSVEVLIVCSGIVIAYAAYKGIEVIGRVCEILGPIYIISTIILFIFVLPQVNIDRLKPQLANGLYPFLSSTPIILSFIGICIIMGMYIPICNHPEKGFISKFTAVSIGCSLIVVLIIISIGVFSLPQTNNMVNVSFELGRAIHISGFFERVEAVILMTSIGASIITSACMIWAFCLGISQILKLKSYKPLVLPAVLLSIIIGLTSFKNSLDLAKFIFYTFPIMAMFIETGLEMFLYITALIFKKKG